MHNDTILDMIVTKCVLDEVRRCHPQQNDSCSLPKTPSSLSDGASVVGGRRRPSMSWPSPTHTPLLLTTTTTKTMETDRGLCLRLPPMMPRGARGASGTTVGNVGRIERTTLADLRRRIRCRCCPSWTKMGVRRATTAWDWKKTAGVGAVDN